MGVHKSLKSVAFGTASQSQSKQSGHGEHQAAAC